MGLRSYLEDAQAEAKRQAADVARPAGYHCLREAQELEVVGSDNTHQLPRVVPSWKTLRELEV
jgi:hypothetical protein